MLFKNKEGYKIIKKQVPKIISKEEAVLIASSNNTLKLDFVKRYQKDITYFNILNNNIKIIEYNHKYYYLYEATNIDISWLETNKEGNITHITGVKTSKFFLDLLRCLVDCETGKYYYYPKTANIANILSSL